MGHIFVFYQKGTNGPLIRTPAQRTINILHRPPSPTAHDLDSLLYNSPSAPPTTGEERKKGRAIGERGQAGQLRRWRRRVTRSPCSCALYSQFYDERNWTENNASAPHLTLFLSHFASILYLVPTIHGSGCRHSCELWGGCQRPTTQDRTGEGQQEEKGSARRKNRGAVVFFLSMILGFFHPTGIHVCLTRPGTQLTHSRPITLTFGLRLRRPSR